MQTGSHGWVPARRLLWLEVSILMLSTVSRSHAPKAIVLAEHWRRYRRDGEREVRDQLVLAYSPIVKHVAGRIASRMPPHVDLADLVSYGLAGLIEAVERYDPARGVKFESFAGLRIRGVIIDAMRSMDWVRARSATRLAWSSAPAPTSWCACNGCPPTPSWPPR